MTSQNTPTATNANTAKTFSLTGGDIPVENVVTKLKFLSNVKPGEKINVRQLFVRDDTDWYQRFVRTMKNIIPKLFNPTMPLTNGESKAETLEFIKFIYNEAIDLICVYNDPRDKFKQDISNMIIENINRSKTGINSLIHTYSEDIKFKSQIGAIVETLDARLSSVRDLGYTMALSQESHESHELQESYESQE